MATVNSSPSYKCWRIVYNSTSVLQLFESTGITKTVNNLFCSSPTDGVTTGFVTSAVGNQQCVAFAATNKLEIPSIKK